MYTTVFHGSDLDLTALEAPASPRLRPIKRVFVEDALDLGELTNPDCKPMKGGAHGEDYTLMAWLKKQSSGSVSPCTTTLSSASDYSCNMSSASADLS
eukprot:TRINITY_DN1249_c1_g2_i1.p1 TRINITY_DN1249_c1_g2~~TRINITY_DN1249_c1_g2_i1.p1  ORF type:complete len:113 (+),score=35.25 TRINITY_DN1249_c1_g2_i1:48-341(+)